MKTISYHLIKLINFIAFLLLILSSGLHAADADKYYPRGKVELPFDDKITFYASFDNCDLLADMSAGERGKADTKARYMEGIQGKSVVLSQDSVNSFGLSTKEHVSFNNQGTLIFWMQPLAWAHGKDLEKDPTYNRFLCSPYSPKGHWCIQRMAYKSGNEIIMFVMTNYGASGMQIHHKSGAWKDGEWHMLALTWKLREFSFYLDGVLVGSKLLAKPVALEEEANNLSFEPRMPTALDEIVAYEIQLGAEDIASLHKAYLEGKKTVTKK